ncbi:hypothetical protein DAC16_90 [Bacteroides phage DAC16]|nr:hypothetical protein DAC16_90 [Bacteroides phage DAC16]QIG64367.1 hypothetical protein DAC23_89 [Bacteroides phage DAC23]
MDKLNILKQTLSKVVNKEIDITIRGNNKFTFSFEGESKQSECKLIQFFGDKIEITEDSGYDEETDMTYIYCSFKN